MGVEARRDEHELRLPRRDQRRHHVLDQRAVDGVAAPARDRQVDRVALARALARRTTPARCPDTAATRGSRRRARRRRARRSPRSRCRGGRPSRGSAPARARGRPCARRAATATLPKKQKPIARAGSAWWPGGRSAETPAARRPAEQRRRPAPPRRPPRAAPPRRSPARPRCPRRSNPPPRAHSPSIARHVAARVDRLQQLAVDRAAPRAAPPRTSRAGAISASSARIRVGALGMAGDVVRRGGVVAQPERGHAGTVRPAVNASAPTSSSSARARPACSPPVGGRARAPGSRSCPPARSPRPRPTGRRAGSPPRSRSTTRRSCHLQDTLDRRSRAGAPLGRRGPHATRRPPASASSRRSACASTPTATATSRSASRAATASAASCTPAAAPPAAASCASSRADVAEHAAIEVLEGARAARLLDRATAADRRRARSRTAAPLAARGAILATGGAAALWSRTTNPPGSFGSGLLLARAAGAALADLEFVQFHPTAVVGIAGPRGLPHHRGRPRRGGDPARRPTASASSTSSRRATRSPARSSARCASRAPRAVSLDMRHVDPARFPNVVAALREAGLDPATRARPRRARPATT